MIGWAVAWMILAPASVWGQSAVWQPQGATTGNIYYNGGNVGIGTTTPTTKLNIANGTGFSPWVNVLGAISLSGYYGGGLIFNDGSRYAGIWVTEGGQTLNFATNGSSGGFGSGWGQMVLKTGNVGIGTVNPQYLLSVNGTIGTKDVIVTNTGWSDYVFRPGYRLRPLSEVNAYIQKHQHLPDIPTEAEVKEKGVSVGEMQVRLLAKIEELTLHMIQVDDRNSRLERQNRELCDRIARLEKAAAVPTPAAAK